ncbi:MAG: colanic acid biosynthesis glycosyltransferase WcaL [Gammaproteobacteria bacterium]|nr:MAG: colanic acid biosynthesis glycosyltransferase WcaL [Gammaproteobacteria bacterium]
MTQIGFFIPEFPCQTHAFFMREREELLKLGVKTELISTRLPLAGAANHRWAERAIKETSYIFPLGVIELTKCVFEIVLSGPRAWLRCLRNIFQISDVSLKDKPKLLAMLIAGALLKRLCHRKSLSHVHVHSCANAANVAMYAHLLGGPTYSLTLHGPMEDYGLNQSQKWLNAAFCIVITKDLIDEVNSKLMDITLPPILLAPMGVNVTEFKRANNYQPVKPPEPIRLVSCGRLHFVKAHDDLLRVVAQLKAKGVISSLDICGSIDSHVTSESYYDELKQLREELDIVEQVNFLGSVSEDKVKEVLEAAHFFCLASLKEPLGVATMEAMAMELPVIVTRSPGVSEMIIDNVDGVLVEPRSPEQFVDNILRLIDSPEQTLIIAKKGRAKIVDKFHSGVSAGKIVQGLQNTNSNL